MTDRNENYNDDESRLLTSPDEERAPVRGEHTAYFYNDNSDPDPEEEADGEEREDYHGEDGEKKAAAPGTRTRLFSILSLTCGIVSLGLCLFFGIPALIVGLFAIIFAAVSRLRLGYFDNLTVIGMVTGIFGTVIGTFMLIATAFFPDFFERFTK